jgi:membrane associated rhomboid family serine protease
MPPLPPVIKALMLICTAVFCVDLLLGRYVPLDAWFALWPLDSGMFMPWQVLTYAFLHGDMLWGHKRLIAFLLASVLAAAAAQMLLTAIVPTRAPTVGASGGLYGLLLAYGVLFPNRTIMPLFPPIPMKARTFVMVFGAIELVMGWMSPNGGVAHFAHLGGMLGGWLMIRYWRGQPPFPARRRR